MQRQEASNSLRKCTKRRESNKEGRCLVFIAEPIFRSMRFIAQSVALGSLIPKATSLLKTKKTRLGLRQAEVLPLLGF